MHRRLWSALAAALVVLGLPLLAGCGESIPSMFRTDSPGGRDIEVLAYTIFAILAGVLVAVWVWLFLAIYRFRKRPESEVKQTHGNLKVEVVWTAIPAVIVAVLFTLTVFTTNQLVVPNTGLMFRVVGHQWWWEIEYPEGEFVTANEIHVPVDRDIMAELLGGDVIHSYWVPQMGGKLDMVPGHVNVATFTPITVGRYIGECGEFCGHQHANMRFLLFVDPVDRFSEWYENEASPAAEPVGELAIAGAQTFVNQPCGGCHTIRGTAAQGTQGPDLTHVGSRESLASVTLSNTPEEMRAWLRDPQAIKPENLMPTVPLTDLQLDQLVAYLEGLE
jgi:cytochrome c oxidase subunit 2